MFKIWLGILKQVPQAVLWLWDQGTRPCRNLKNFAQESGVDPKRLIFSPRLPNPQHLQRLSLSDLALDTRIYGGHTTTSDYLRAGVPLITRLGHHFASRVAASILTTYGVPELITRDLDSYQQLAVNLAKNKQKLKAIRAKILSLRNHNPLFDTHKFVAQLEKAYLTIWQTYQISSYGKN